MTTHDAPTGELTDEQIGRLCDIFLSGFCSGYGSLAGHLASDGPLGQAAASAVAAHQARHIAHAWLEDPATRHTLRDDMVRLFTGQVTGTEARLAHIHRIPKDGEQ